jgi:Ca2+-binding EF-hand superfamily protein
MSLPSQQPLTVSELSMLRALFARIDSDGDGKIDIDDLKEVFKQNGWELTEHEAKVCFVLYRCVLCIICLLVAYRL